MGNGRLKRRCLALLPWGVWAKTRHCARGCANAANWVGLILAALTSTSSVANVATAKVCHWFERPLTPDLLSSSTFLGHCP